MCNQTDFDWCFSTFYLTHKIAVIKNIQWLFIGRSFIFGLTSDKQVFGWGSNAHGQIGRGYASQRNEYLKPEVIDFPFKNVIQLSCGSDHSLSALMWWQSLWMGW